MFSLSRLSILGLVVVIFYAAIYPAHVIENVKRVARLVGLSANQSQAAAQRRNQESNQAGIRGWHRGNHSASGGDFMYGASIDSAVSAELDSALFDLRQDRAAQAALRGGATQSVRDLQIQQAANALPASIGGVADAALALEKPAPADAPRLRRQRAQDEGSEQEAEDSILPTTLAEAVAGTETGRTAGTAPQAGAAAGQPTVSDLTGLPPGYKIVNGVLVGNGVTADAPEPDTGISESDIDKLVERLTDRGEPADRLIDAEGAHIKIAPADASLVGMPVVAATAQIGSLTDTLRPILRLADEPHRLSVEDGPDTGAKR